MDIVKEPIPTTDFSPSRHVLVGRRMDDGGQEFFTLASVSAAEQIYEGAIDAPKFRALEERLAALESPVSANRLADVEQRLSAIDASLGTVAPISDYTADLAAIEARIRADIPPPSSTVEITQALSELTQVLLALKMDVAKLSARVDGVENLNAIHELRIEQIVTAVDGHSDALNTLKNDIIARFGT